MKIKKYSAQYVAVGTGKFFKYGIISVDAEGKITEITDTKSTLYEQHSLEFHNGIIVPKFVDSALIHKLNKNYPNTSFIYLFQTYLKNSKQKIKTISIGENPGLNIIRKFNFQTMTLCANSYTQKLIKQKV